jgi:dUTP pyrophosphatase
MNKVTESLTWEYVRESFNFFGDINIEQTTCTLRNTIIAHNFHSLSEVAQFSKLPYILTNNGLTYSGTNAIDFLGKVYKDCEPEDKHYSQFTRLLTAYRYATSLPLCKVFKNCENAIIPSKSKESDAGYDLTVISIEKKFSDKVTLYDTGISIQIDNGYYAEVIPRSSLSKSGYILANSVGIIDASYRGSIYIALMKVDPNAPDIVLPFRCCQLLFRPQVHVLIKQTTESLQDTQRGQGGFGSTN